MIYKITHTTLYQYSENVDVCHNEARLRPLTLLGQQCLKFEVVIDPAPKDYRERLDFFGNHVCYFAIYSAHKSLTITATSTVWTAPRETDPKEAQAFTWEQVVAAFAKPKDIETLEAGQFTLNSPLVVVNQEMANYAGRSFAKGRSFIAAVTDLMDRIHREFTYDPHFSTIATPLLDVMKHRRGVCQDFAHLAIGCLRSIGLAARYVSGYMETLPPAGQERLVGADASHAWFSIFVPGYGWIDFDPTNNQMPTDQYITVAVGRDFHDVTPIKGVIFGGGDHKLLVSVDVAGTLVDIPEPVNASKPNE